MSYPQVLIDVEKMDENLRQLVTDEYQRFKDVQLTGIDRLSKPVAQILRDPPGELSGNKTKDFSQMREHYEPVYEPQPAIPADMQEELMRRIRAQENHCSGMLHCNPCLSSFLTFSSFHICFQYHWKRSQINR